MGRATVAEVLVDVVAHAGARHLFVGAGAARPAHALLAAAARRGLAPVPTPTAAAAAGVAAVAGELTGAPGLAVVPGAALAEAGAALEYAALNGAPLLVLVPEAAPRPPRAPHVDVTAERAGEAAARAVRAALAPPGGPVVVTVTADLDAPAAVEAGAPAAAPAALDPAALAAVAAHLGAAARPVLVAGLETRSRAVAAWLQALAEALPAPVVVSPKARGALPDAHPLVLGPFGAPGALAALAHADLVLTVGLAPAEAPTVWPTDAPRIHVGATPAPGAAAAATGDVALALEELAPRLRGRARADWDVALLAHFRRANARAPTTPEARAVARVRACAPPGTIATAAGAEARALEVAWWVAGPQECLVPVGVAPPGYACLAAAAAALTAPARRVVGFAAGEPAPAALALLAGVGRPVAVALLGAAGVEDDRALAAALARAWARSGPTVIALG